jgi:uncharacterized protein YqgV (UPF0045/DUF77 family)
MDFKKIEAIKNSIEFFEDAEFYSMAAKDAVIVKNIENEVLWEVPFTLVEGITVFDGKKAKIVGEEIIDDDSDEELIEEDVDVVYGENGKLTDITKEILMEEIDMNMLRDKILNYSFKTKEKSSNYRFEEVNEVRQEKESKILSLFSESLSKYEKEKEIFMANGYMFNENEEIKKEFMVDPVYLTTLYEEKVKNSQKFFTFIEHEYSKAMSIVNKVNEAFEDTEIPANELFEGIDFTKKEDVKNKILKNLLVIKKKHNLDFSINEMNKKVDGLLSELYPLLEAFDLNHEGKFSVGPSGFSQLASEDPRFPDRSLKFLKVNFNAFNREDIIKLMEELNYAIAKLSSIGDDPENYKMLFVMRNALDYMSRKDMIDDGVVVNIIKTFNDRYGKDQSANFNDAEKGLPFSPSAYGQKDMMSALSSGI